MKNDPSHPDFEVRSTAVVTRFLHKIYSVSGLDADEIFRMADIDLSLIEDPNYRVPHCKLLTMWEIAGDLSSDPDFGLHLSEKSPAPPFNAAGYMAMTSKNLRQMLDVLHKYINIFTDRGEFLLKVSGDEAMVCIDVTGGLQPSRQHSDFWQAFFYKNISNNIGWQLPLSGVGFRHEKPDDVSQYEKIFKAPIKFSQKINYFVFPSVYLDYEVISADTNMNKYHEQQAIQHLNALTEIGIVNKVRRIIFEMLPAKDVELQYVADKLNLTARTVQRNLASEGITFKKILDEARKDHTISEIKDTTYSVSEIAYRLGYRDLSSFYRAFKRWTGLTPVEFREKLKD